MSDSRLQPALGTPDSADAIRALRQLMPSRALTWAESHAVAEWQATLLLQLSQVDEPPVPQFIISSLPGIVVEWRQGWPTSGSAVETRSHWHIVIAGDDPRWRQRFSLAHEFKHVLDRPMIDRLFTRLPRWQRAQRAERLCNYFAACLLMPRAWIKRDWCSGLQRVPELARRYYVSEEAMSTRLSEIGLTPMSLALEPGQRRHLGAAA